VTLGYFGTYKKLEILLDAFQLVRHSLPDAKLTIGGQNSPRTPGYLEDLFHRYADRLDNVEFLGYVKDEDIPGLFWSANVICVTNATNPGSSAVLRLAAAHGRGVIMPCVDLFRNLQLDHWGVKYYEAGNSESLAITLLEILTNPDQQAKMAYANYRKALQSNHQFQKAHLQAFRDLSRLASRQRGT
jgi:glycosyltransferase involved in cell wall biosynthesis